MCGGHPPWPTAPPPRARRSPAAHAAQLVLDVAALGGEIKVAPAPEGAVRHASADVPAARARRPAAPECDTDSDAIGAEEHVGDAGALQRQQAVECGRDPHGFLPRSLSFEHPAACRNDGRAGRSTPVQAPTTSPTEKDPAPTRSSARARSTQTTGDPKKEHLSDRPNLFGKVMYGDRETDGEVAAAQPKLEGPWLRRGLGRRAVGQTSTGAFSTETSGPSSRYITR